ncbi:DnaJ-domain-containing protein [Pisolithus croceorrhizus]|nr:DnaJ-domain-containing protein [Pisolithus croceorrhizus]
MSSLLQVAGWSILPDLLTRHTLSFIYQTVFKFLHRSPPLQGSPVYARHYRYTYTTVVLGYLLYNFVAASTALPKNFYQLLDVRPDTADNNELKVAFRAFAKKYHPDRVGPQGEAYFIQVRDAFEALKDPVVRFAYDRFGPDVLRWKECNTMKEYLRRGLLSSLAYHVMAGAGLVLVSMIGKPSPIAMWRYLLFAVTLALELHLLLALSSQVTEQSPFVDHIPTSGTLFDPLFPRRVAYQHIQLLRNVFLFLSIALSRVAPVLFPSMMRSDSVVDQQMTKAVAERLGTLAKLTERELSIMQNVTLNAILDSSDSEGISTEASELPNRLDDDVMRLLTDAMEDILIESRLKSEAGPMRSAWDRAVERRKQQMKLERHVSSVVPSLGHVSGENSDPKGQEIPLISSVRRRSLRARSVSL